VRYSCCGSTVCLKSLSHFYLGYSSILLTPVCIKICVDTLSYKMHLVVEFSSHAVANRTYVCEHSGWMCSPAGMLIWQFDTWLAAFSIRKSTLMPGLTKNSSKHLSFDMSSRIIICDLEKFDQQCCRHEASSGVSCHVHYVTLEY